MLKIEIYWIVMINSLGLIGCVTHRPSQDLVKPKLGKWQQMDDRSIDGFDPTLESTFFNDSDHDDRAETFLSRGKLISPSAHSKHARNRRVEIPLFPKIRNQRLTDQYLIYTIRAGDTLIAIAEKFLGNANSWRRIARKNGIRHPKRLVPYQKILIPRKKS